MRPWITKGAFQETIAMQLPRVYGVKRPVHIACVQVDSSGAKPSALFHLASLNRCLEATVASRKDIKIA